MRSQYYRRPDGEQRIIADHATNRELTEEEAAELKTV